jgi:hypothetical protein
VDGGGGGKWGREEGEEKERNILFVYERWSEEGNEGGEGCRDVVELLLFFFSITFISFPSSFIIIIFFFFSLILLLLLFFLLFLLLVILLLILLIFHPLLLLPSLSLSTLLLLSFSWHKITNNIQREKWNRIQKAEMNCCLILS